MHSDQDLLTEPTTAPTLLQVFVSVAWSFFGVQNSRNRRRDFPYGKPWQFIVLGVVMTAIVVLAFVGAAKLALHLVLPA